MTSLCGNQTKFVGKKKKKVKKKNNKTSFDS